MSTVTSQNQTAPVVRQYEIGGVRYIVKATVKDGAKETAVKKIRRLLQNDLRFRTVRRKGLWSAAPIRSMTLP